MKRSILVFVVAMASAGNAAETSAPVSEPNRTGYPTVAAALDGLRAKPGARETAGKAWTTIQDMEGENIVLWSFTVPSHPAHPSVVKRTLQKKEDGYYIDMNILCEASDKAACAGLVPTFQALNEQVRRSLAEGK